MDNEKSIETIKLFTKLYKKDIAVVIEEGIKNFAIEHCEYYETLFLIENIYDEKVGEIYNALVKNPELVKTIEDARLIAKAKPEELNPEKYESILKKKEIEEYKKTDIKSSSAFKCSKCKKSKCTVIQKQIRAGDEPATIFVTCLECGHEFSFS
jgi:DNA-directed RNA polymerase subunit M/transcription elongation factor TFIIS